MIWQLISRWTATTKGLYHFDWGSTDSSGNSFNLTPSNVSFVVWKNGSGSASFNGSSSFISWTFNFDVWTNGTVSVFTWIYLNSISTIKTILFKWKAGVAFNFSLSTWTSWQLQFWNTYNNYAISNNSAITTWKWYRVWFVSSWWITTWYINWEQKLSISQWTTATSINELRIWNYSASVQAVDWFIDELIIEARQWTSLDAKKDYTNSKWRFLLN